jgi:hypothetical protein
MTDEASADRERRILTRHPEGKQGVNISRYKYEAMKASILRSMRGRGEVPLQVMREEVERDLQDTFEGSVS